MKMVADEWPDLRTHSVSFGLKVSLIDLALAFGTAAPQKEKPEVDSDSEAKEVGKGGGTKTCGEKSNSDSMHDSAHLQSLQHELARSCMSAVVAPGELVYWPSDWWHESRNLGNFPDEDRGYAASDFFSSSHIHKSNWQNGDYKNPGNDEGGRGSGGATCNGDENDESAAAPTTIVEELTIGYSGMSVDDSITTPYMQDYLAWEREHSAGVDTTEVTTPKKEEADGKTELTTQLRDRLFTCLKAADG
jgi:hypothetical protein